MHWITTALAVLSIGFVGSGCGGESSDPGSGLPFQSKAKAPTGDPIRIAYAYGAGDGLRMTITSEGEMEISGEHADTVPMNSTMTIAMRCSEVRDDGDRVLAILFEGMMRSDNPTGASTSVSPVQRPASLDGP